MNKRSTTATIRSSWVVFIALFMAIGFTACDSGTKPVEEDTEGTPPLQVPSGLRLSGQVPYDVPVGAPDDSLAAFAWNEFFALNWEADVKSKVVQRGVPSSSSTASTNLNPDLAVWETYLHRTELIQTQSLANTDLTTGDPDYYNYINSKSVTDKSGILKKPIWNLLDEDNEIGSCFLFYIDGKDTTEVLYMAKANLSEYSYLKGKYPTVADQKAAANKIGLDSLTKYTKAGLTCDQDAAKATGKNAYFKKTVCFPCSDQATKEQGVIEIKTAWRKLYSTDTKSDFITKEVIYFEDSSSTTVPRTSTMALIGMHIIHKTRNYPSFIFATWEHKSVRTGPGQYTYITSKYNPHDPVGANAVIDRVPKEIPPILANYNTLAEDLITGADPSSPWQHYQLTGVQATPIDYSTYQADSTKSEAYWKESSYFLANYVIESDKSLTRFHGSFGDPFNSTIKNVVWKGNQLNMGGCQGCHGEAANSGKNYSFLVGSAATEPDPLESFAETLKANMKNTSAIAPKTEAERKALEQYLAAHQ